MLATPLFINESSSMKEMLASLPEAALDAMGIDLELFFSAVGFYSYVFTYIGLAAAIQAMSLGMGILSKENRMKTADFLMSKPKSRSSIFLAKLAACLCSLFVTGAVFFLAAWLSILTMTGGDFAFAPFALISLSFLLLQMIFLSVGLLAAALVGRIKSVVSVTIGIVFGVFLLGIISSIAGSEALRWLSPFRYFDYGYAMKNHTYEGLFMILSAALILGAGIASYVIQMKKDIKAAA